MRAIRRLRVIADLVSDENGIVADVGADHGFLAKMLIDEKKAKYVITTDISAPSLEKTVNLIKKYNLEDFIETRVGDGLKPILKENIDTVIIAGMGGYEIIKILQENTNKNINEYILQPVQNTIELRKFLNDNNYWIFKDFVVEDKNKFYSTIVVKKLDKKQVLTKEEIEFGLTNFDLKSDEFYNYLKNIELKLDSILNEKNAKIINTKLKNVRKILKKLF